MIPVFDSHWIHQFGSNESTGLKIAQHVVPYVYERSQTAQTYLAYSLQNLEFALNRRDTFSEGRLKENTEDSSREIRNLGELMEKPVSIKKIY